MSTAEQIITDIERLMKAENPLLGTERLVEWLDLCSQIRGLEIQVTYFEKRAAFHDRLVEALEVHNRFLKIIATRAYTISGESNAIGHYDAESGLEDNYNKEAQSICDEIEELLAEAREEPK